MKELLEKVKEFHKTFGLEDTQNYKKNPGVFTLRYNLGREELTEYSHACLDKNEVEIADALGDQLYILLGTILAHGLEDKIVDVFNEIHRSNMSKLGEDGKPIYRADGKILKGSNYFKPNLTYIIRNEESNNI